ALPLHDGVVVREVKPGAVLFDQAGDGPLAEGWALVWFAREDDPRATDLPMVVYPNRSPARIAVAAGGGLTWQFAGPGRNALTLLPLEGIAAVDKSVTQAWVGKGTLPSGVQKRIRTWQGRSQRLPVGVEETWQYLPKRNAFEIRQRFAYSESLSQWPVEETLI